MNILILDWYFINIGHFFTKFYPTPLISKSEEMIPNHGNGPKAGHRSTLAFLRFCVIAATGIRKHTQVESLWITRRIRRISAFPSNSERLDASVFTSTLPATKRNSRTISTRATDVIFEHKHCSPRRRHTQVEITSAHKQLGNSRTITRNRWHGARIS